MNDSIEQKITQKIDDIVEKNNIYHVGKVIKINSFVIEVSGLDDAFYFEKITIKDESNIGYVDKIEENKVIVALVKQGSEIRIGDSVLTSGEVISSSFSKDALGMVINPFGHDEMTGRKFSDSKRISIETPKIEIMDRTEVNRPLETGIAAIDLLFPIGRGQRQLIIGDKKTGKTQICLDTIVNQKDKNMICVYVAIGKTKKELKKIYTKLVQKGASQYTIIVAAFNDDLAPLIKLTPYVGVSIAEQFMYEGNDVLVCIDDLKKHADACREIALISEKNTGRDAYPADIFYSHSRLLEKGCQHVNKGSITILPVTETKGEDITDYISTNIISITDGQIVMSNKWFKKGQKPAINYGLSVSRLGGAVQKDSIKKIGSKVRQELLSYLETADVYQLVDVNSLSPELKEKITRGNQLLNLLKQPKFSPLSEEKLVEKFGFILEDKKQEQVVNETTGTDGSNGASMDNQANNTNGEDSNNSYIDNGEHDNQNTHATNYNYEQNTQEVTESNLSTQTDVAIPENNEAAPAPLTEMPNQIPVTPVLNNNMMENSPSEIPLNSALTDNQTLSEIQATNNSEKAQEPNNQAIEPVPMISNVDLLNNTSTKESSNVAPANNSLNSPMEFNNLPEFNKEIIPPTPNLTNINDNNLVNNISITLPDENKDHNKSSASKNIPVNDGEVLPNLAKDNSKTLSNKPIFPTLSTDVTTKTDAKDEKTVKPVLKPAKEDKNSIPEIEPKLEKSNNNIKPSLNPIKPEITNSSSVKPTIKEEITKPTLEKEKVKEVGLLKPNLDKELKDKNKTNIEVGPKPVIEKEDKNKKDENAKDNSQIWPKLDSTNSKPIGPALKTEDKKETIKPSLEKENSNKSAFKDIGPSLKPPLKDDKAIKPILKPGLDGAKADKQKEATVNNNSEGKQIKPVDLGKNNLSSATKSDIDML